MEAFEVQLKEAYSLKIKPIFTTEHRKNVRPAKNSAFLKNFGSQVSPNLPKKSEPDMQNHNSQKSKNPKDTTEPPTHEVNKNYEYPYSSIGLITCQFREQKSFGTGFLIGPKFVLTCAQNIRLFREKEVGKSITFTPAYKNNGENITFRVKQVHFPQEILKIQALDEESMQFNFALIELDCGNIQNDFGTLGINFDPNSTDLETPTIIGYNRFGTGIEICEFNEEAKQECKQVQYDMKNGHAMNGSPVIRNVDGEIRLLGMNVFVRLKREIFLKKVVRVDEKILKYLDKWCTCEEEELDLRQKLIGKEGVKQLCKRKWINLVSLNLSRNNLENNVAKYLKKGHWNHLRNLDLGGNIIRQQGAKALAESQLLLIETLNLWGNAIGKQGIQYLSRANWSHLTNLNLYCNDIHDEGVSCLVQSNWKLLNSLNLGKNQITSTGVLRILQGSWEHFASLNLWGNCLNGEQAKLKQKLTNHFKLLKFVYI